MKKIGIFLFILILAGLCSAQSTYYVRQPIQMTDDGENEYYDRGMDITYGNGYYWLVYGKCTDDTFEGLTNEEYLVPDGSGGYRPYQSYVDFNSMISPCSSPVYYNLYYKKAVSIEALANATENQILVDGVNPITNVNMGEVYCEFYDNKIFVFTTQGAGTDIPGEYNQLFYTMDGSTWTNVGEIFDDVDRGRYDFTIYDGELWAVNGNTEVVHVSDPTSLSAWQNVTPISIITDSSLVNAPIRFFIDPSPVGEAATLYLAASTTGGGNIIFDYNGTQFEEYKVLDIKGDYPVLHYDPYNEKYFYIVASSSFFVHDGFLASGLFQAHSYFMYWAADAMSEFLTTTRDYESRWKILDPAQFPNVNTEDDNPWDINTWVDYSSQIIVDDQGATPSNKTYFFYSSQCILNDPQTDQQSADIFCIPFDWDNLETHHFNFISTAFSQIDVRRYTPDIAKTIGNGGSPIEYSVQEDYYTFSGVADNDRLELMGGTYTENVAVDADVTIDGNKVAEINPAIRGYSFVINDNTDCTIEECMIMDGIQNNGSGTVTAINNYWGEGGPTAAMIDNIGGGAVDYIPWYADEAMTTPAYPSPDAVISFNGTTATITWTVDYPGATYKIYGSDDPSLALGSWTNLGSQSSGYTNSTYQFYAVTATVASTEYTAYVGKAGYFTHALQTGYNFIPISLDYGYDNVMDMAADLGNPTYDYTISVWNASSQGWISASKTALGWDPEVGIDIQVGDVVLFNSGTNTPSTVYLAGAVADSWMSFDLVTTSTTDMNLIYVPLNKASLSSLSALGDDIGTTNCNSLSIWDAGNQGWISASYLPVWEFWTHGDEEVGIGDAIMVGALQNFTWPQ